MRNDSREARYRRFPSSVHITLGHITACDVIDCYCQLSAPGKDGWAQPVCWHELHIKYPICKCAEWAGRNCYFMKWSHIEKTASSVRGGPTSVSTRPVRCANRTTAPCSGYCMRYTIWQQNIQGADDRVLYRTCVWEECISFFSNMTVLLIYLQCLYDCPLRIWENHNSDKYKFSHRHHTVCTVLSRACARSHVWQNLSCQLGLSVWIKKNILLTIKQWDGLRANNMFETLPG